MSKEKLCPKWAQVTGSIGNCAENHEWFCEKSYASGDYQCCPFYTLAEIVKKKLAEAKNEPK